MSEVNKDLARRMAEEIWNKGNLALVDEMFAQQYVYRNPMLPEGLMGPKAYKDLVTAYRTAFPDFHVTIDDLVAENDKIVARWTVHGTHKSVLQDPIVTVPPTYKEITWSGVTISRVQNGKFIEDFMFGDALGFARQLGVLSQLERVQAARG